MLLNACFDRENVMLSDASQCRFWTKMLNFESSILQVSIGFKQRLSSQN